VKLYLPRAMNQAQPATNAPRIPASHPTGTEVILLVDDNLTLMEVTRRQLTSWGYKVIPAASGRSALAILEAGEPVDLLFTDVIMPGGMSGPELVESAQRLRPGLKALFATGYAAEPAEYRGHLLLRKPYDRRNLARAVRTVLDGLVMAD
jgi:CheY-like chemotaxis protein